MRPIKYFSQYVTALDTACRTVDEKTFNVVCDLIHGAAFNNRTILVFGNGGSASIAEHLSADWTKGIAHDSKYNGEGPNVISLVSNQSLMTAIANDYGYEHVFGKQIEYYHGDDPLVVAISSSGNSRNIIDGLDAANNRGFTSIALVGFDGGLVVSGAKAHKILHVKSYNYGLVEDAHSVIMHSIAQHIRLQMSSSPDAVKL